MPTRQTRPSCDHDPSNLLVPPRSCGLFVLQCPCTINKANCTADSYVHFLLDAREQCSSEEGSLVPGRRSAPDEVTRFLPQERAAGRGLFVAPLVLRRVSASVLASACRSWRCSSRFQVLVVAGSLAGELVSGECCALLSAIFFICTGIYAIHRKIGKNQAQAHGTTCSSASSASQRSTWGAPR